MDPRAFNLAGIAPWFLLDLYVTIDTAAAATAAASHTCRERGSRAKEGATLVPLASALEAVLLHTGPQLSCRRCGCSNSGGGGVLNVGVGDDRAVVRGLEAALLHRTGVRDENIQQDVKLLEMRDFCKGASLGDKYG